MALPNEMWEGLFLQYKKCFEKSSEASDDFHYAIALCIFGTIIGRRVHLYYARELYPNFFMVIEGPTGAARKTTAMRFGEKVLVQFPELKKVWGISSAEGLIRVMGGFSIDDGVEKPKSHSTILMIEEFATMLRKGKQESLTNLTPALTNFYDSLSEDTEVLTPNGWRGINDNITEAITLNMQSGKLETCPVLSKQIHDPNPQKRMVRFHSKSLDILVTDNHKMVALPRIEGRFKNRKLLNASDLAIKLHDSHYCHGIPVSGSLNNTREDILTDDELRLMAWFYTDGCDNEIYQSEGNFCNDIDNLLFRMGISYKKSKKNSTKLGFSSIKKQYRFSIYANSYKKYKHLLVKDLPLDILMNLSNRQWDLFLDTLVMGDGTKQSLTRANRVLWVHKESDVSKLQAAAIVHGWQSTAKKDSRGKDCYHITFTKRPLVQASTHTGVTVYPSYTGRTWCISSINRTICIRRNGKVAIVGNSPPRVDLPTRKRPLTVESPFLSILAGTTYDWMESSMSEEEVMGGFANRFAYIRGKPKAYMSKPQKPLQGDIEALVQGIKEAMGSIKSDYITLSTEADAIWDKHYGRWVKTKRDGIIAEMVQRVPEYSLKCALVHAVMAGHKNVEAADVEKGIIFGKILETNIDDLFGSFSLSQYGKVESRIIQLLKEKNPRSKRDIHQHISGRVAADRLARIIQGLESNEIISTYQVGPKTYMKLVKDTKNAEDNAEEDI